MSVGLIALIVVGVVVVHDAAGGGAGQASASRRATTATGRAAATGASKARICTDPLTIASVKRYLAARRGKVTAAVADLNTGQEWLLNRGDRDQTASIVKTDILETLLHQHDTSRSVLGWAAGDATEVQGMIEESDNADASALWDAVGGASGIAAYDRLAGLVRTSPGAGGYWGETLTTAADQIKLLRQLVTTSKLLTPVAQRYQLFLMRHIEPGQGWGVSGGVPKGVTVELKNGWVPLSSCTDWEVNSIGWVHGDGRDYLVAVLTAHDPSENYGIATIDHLAAAVYKGLRPST